MALGNVRSARKVKSLHSLRNRPRCKPNSINKWQPLLHSSLGLDETLLAKLAFERHTNNGGISVTSYPANTGCFTDAGFQKAIKDANQSITFCAVGAYHQNGIVERRIKELTLISRTLLLHAKQHWPDYITTMMWLFALKEAAYWLNQLSLRSGGCSCEATFFNIDADLFDPTPLHVFGLLCFVLDSRLQSGIAGPPKWEPRSIGNICWTFTVSYWFHCISVKSKDWAHLSSISRGL